MNFGSMGRMNSHGNFDRRYATGTARTGNQRRADQRKSVGGLPIRPK